MDSSLRVRHRSPLVHPAYANARSSELFQQELVPSYKSTDLLKIPASIKERLMIGTAFRFLRQRLRRHCRKTMHIAQTALVLERRRGQTGRTDPERQVHLLAHGQRIEEAEVMIVPYEADVKRESAELAAALGAHSAQPGVLHAPAFDDEGVVGEENGHGFGVDEAAGEEDS